MRSILKNIIAFTLLLSAVSCKDWLDVKMDDKIMESALYSENSGFMKALNGIYLKMNSVYSSDLTCGIMDILAQYYNVTDNNDHTYKEYAKYNYNEANFESKNGSVWGLMYEMIANINVLLRHCDDGGSALKADYYPFIKGEALALRAMLHFDLLRIYGPVPGESSFGTPCIPYVDDDSRNVFPYSTAGEVLDKVTADLTAAADLLRPVDPIITEGVITEIPEDDGTSANDMSYRQLRLNYYAVQGLLARVSLWKGDKTEAYRIAKNEIIDKVMEEDGDGIFSWTTTEAYEASGKEDYMFSSEVMFALYNSKRSDVYRSYFSQSLNSKKNRLTFIGSNLSGESKAATLYDDDNDWRKGMWKVAEPTDAEIKDAEENGYVAEGSLYLDKYKDFSSDATTNGSEIYRYMMPLVRLSEMYLIAAECTPDHEEALALINELRSHRNCISISDDNGILEDIITKEFAKEMIGEGQLFFYYKRLGKAEMISGTAYDGVTEMNPANYVWPLPKAETDKRVELE